MTSSIYGRLLISLGLFVSLAGISMFLLVAVDYHIPLTALIEPSRQAGAWGEIELHVLWPLMIVLALAVVAIVPIVRFTLYPLMLARARLEAARDSERGFRLNAEKFPSEIKPFAEAVNRLLFHLEELAAQQEAFAADVAHELRTPLAILSLEIDGLEQPARDRLKAEVRAMERLIDQLLLLAQVDRAGKKNVPRQAVDLEELATDVVAALAPAAIANGRFLAVEKLGPSCVIAGWREAAAAAVRNLVENALRVTPDGSTVIVSVGPGPVLNVQDGGPGIEPERLRELAGRHVRADHASASGAGLGLAIVERIMAAHKGALLTDPQKRTLSLHFRDEATLAARQR
jgi:two-component system, OmpR family, sensor kinase